MIKNKYFKDFNLEEKYMLANGIQFMSQTAAGAESFPSEVRQSL